MVATGFVVATNRILTAAHALTGTAPGGWIMITSRSSRAATGTVMRLDMEVDLALIEADTSDALPLQLGQMAFEEVTAIGYGMQGQQVRVGRVVGIIDGPGRPEILTSEISMPGFSGAPALNNKGHVVGVVRSHDSRDASTHLIPAQLVKQFLSEEKAP
jgi:S1-C subfamily serine protease